MKKMSENANISVGTNIIKNTIIAILLVAVSLNALNKSINKSSDEKLADIRDKTIKLVLNKGTPSDFKELNRQMAKIKASRHEDEIRTENIIYYFLDSKQKIRYYKPGYL